MNPSRRLVNLAVVSLLLVGLPVFSLAQEPSPPPPPPTNGAPPAQPPASSSASSSSKDKHKYSHANDFLIRGTVFTDKAYAFPGVRLRIRRYNEKKFRWESFTNSRGEFAVRVPQGLEYEMVIHAKGFADQTRAIEATSGISETSVTFQMQPAGGTK
jgi:hypothetical protein